MYKLILLGAFIFIMVHSTRIDSRIFYCDKLETLFEKYFNFRSFTVLITENNRQILNSYSSCQNRKNAIKNREKLLQEKINRRLEEERRNIIQQYLKPRTGPTSILKDLVNRI